MKELQEIIQVWKQLLPEQTAALATLVKVEGSAYRRPGARMLITSDGQQVGTISGGCLESDVVERSQQVLKTGISTLVKYDTTSEDDLIWGLGLGCQGVAYILIEPLKSAQANVLSLIDQCLSTRQAGAVATVFRVEGTNTVETSDYAMTNPTDRILINPDGSVISTITNFELKDLVTQDTRSVFQQQQSRSQVYRLSEEIVEVFLEVIQPPTSLIIFGAGFDVLPVVHFAKELGWYVTVIDPQGRTMTAKRFDECDRVVFGLSELTESQIKFNKQTVVVVMSHNYLYDLEFLQTLSSLTVKYLGILGPKQRTNRLLLDLQSEGFIPQLESELYSPVGLDLGADNPEAIALSIIAEIQAVIQNRQGGFLKHRSAPIHSEQPRYVQPVSSWDTN
ncbi:XdhC/CoxI family protein [Pleurocapsa sp. PCC 7319]|uniref:XdhC family protein n=1 Tax=Pleurocapsa sp. PCC 7319 TaxID=118161 RepID=UPI00034A04B8|nr:XdhC/CoxI family protein [Pleurocapsa sp. PCC 7319]